MKHHHNRIARSRATLLSSVVGDVQADPIAIGRLSLNIQGVWSARQAAQFDCGGLASDSLLPATLESPKIVGSKSTSRADRSPS